MSRIAPQGSSVHEAEPYFDGEDHIATLTNILPPLYFPHGVIEARQPDGKMYISDSPILRIELYRTIGTPEEFIANAQKETKRGKYPHGEITCYF